TALVPAHALLREIAVGQSLAICLRTVLVHPADHPHELLLPSIAPQSDLILLHGVNPVFGFFTAADPLRPHIAQQSIGQQAKLEWRFAPQIRCGNFGSETALAQRDAIAPGLELPVKAAAWR